MAETYDLDCRVMFAEKARDIRAAAGILGQLMCIDMVQKTKSSSEIAGMLSHYRKSNSLTTEEIDQVVQDYIRKRAARADREAFRQILANVPGVDVISGDEISVE